MKKILLINPFGIGDVLFTTPIIHTLKDSFPEIKIGYLCNRRTASILENNPFIDFVFIYERDEFQKVREGSFINWVKKNLDFLDKIKQQGFDLAIDFSLNSQYGFFSWFAGIRERVGYNYKNRGWLLSKKIKLEGYCDKHIVEYYADLLKLISIDLKYRKLELYINQIDLAWAEAFLNRHRINSGDLLVAIIPGAGASWGKDAYLKRWSPDNFAAVSDKIIENYKAKIIIMGDLSEKEVAKSMLNTLHYETIDACGETNLGQFAALLSRMNLVITNDGGPMHLAVALGIKTVSIFGPVDEKVYGIFPPSDNHIIIKKDLSCRPCYQKFRMPRCFRDRECINSISIEEVFEAARKLL